MSSGDALPFGHRDRFLAGVILQLYQRLRLWSDTSFRFWPAVVAVTGLAALGSGYWFLATSGSRRLAGPVATAGRVPPDAEQLRLSDTAGEQEKTYRRLAAAGVGGDEAIAALDRGIDAERELLRRNPQAGVEQNVRLARLATARDNERAKQASARVAALEQAADEARAAAHPDAALEHLRAALRAQREVDNSDADMRFKDFVREMSLTQAVEKAEAAPLHHEVESARQAAQAAVAAQHWSEALAAYARARDAQRTLNQNYARTPFVDLAGLDRIESEIASLNAAGRAAAVDAREKEADAAAERGRAQEAAGLYRAAAKLQRELNAQFARSRFFSTRRIEQLEVKRQTALAAEMLAAVGDLDRAAAAALLKRQVLAATGKIASATALVELVEKDYPKTLNFDAAVKLKLSYLGVRGDELRTLQDQTYDRLVPVPEKKNLLMLKTEVPQALYTKVMSSNPSRHPGAQLPVDSVSWNDAQEFCQRLSWILGTRVRLPTADEYRAALADGDGAVWSAENAGGQSRATGSQTANSAGFFDLAGNLAEWLQGDAGDGSTAPVAGGSYLDAVTTLRTPPMVLAAKGERARHVGFRVIVELALD